MRTFTSPTSIGLKQGDSGAEVKELQSFLQRFGYLDLPAENTSFSAIRDLSGAVASTEGQFDEATTDAISAYQEFHDLPVSGVLDEATVAQMGEPRCGFPDIVRPSSVAEFVAQGNKWDKTDLTYGFENFTPDLSQEEVRTAIAGSFRKWSAVSALTFAEVDATANPDIRILFAAGNHGDRDPFDGRGRVLAHAYYPPPNGGDIAGDAHFDEDEPWSIVLPVTGIDLITVAIHEFGHSLGLAHSSVRDAIMFASYSGAKRFLHSDDIAGIQSIYGTRYNWHSLGGRVLTPFAYSNQDGRLEVLVVGSDGALWQIWQTSPNNGWSGWNSLSGRISNPVASRNQDGRLEVFARGSDGALWHIWQTSPNNGWSRWASLGGVMTNPVVHSNDDGRLEVFARGTDGALWHIWQTAPNDGWSTWASLGGLMTNPVVGRNADGRLEVFARGSDGALWHIWQTVPNGGWSAWASLGGGITAPTVGSNLDGRLEVFAVGTDQALWHIWQTSPNNGWSSWASLGGRVAVPKVASNKDGRMEVFVRGSDNALWHIWQTMPNNGWSEWFSFGGEINIPTVHNNQDGRLEVFTRGSDGALWHIWQTSPNNGWN